MLPGPGFLDLRWIHCLCWSVWADFSPIITLLYVLAAVVLLDVLKLVSPIFSIRMEKMQPIRAHDFTFWLAAIQYPFWYKNEDDQLVIIHSVYTTIVNRECVVPNYTDNHWIWWISWIPSGSPIGFFEKLVNLRKKIVPSFKVCVLCEWNFDLHHSKMPPPGHRGI